MLKYFPQGPQKASEQEGLGTQPSRGRRRGYTPTSPRELTMLEHVWTAPERTCNHAP